MESLLSKAGRQRMLSERMVKSYVQIVSGIAPQAATDELVRGIQEFDARLVELKEAASDAHAASALAEAEGAWGRFRVVVAMPCARERVGEMRSVGQRLGRAAERTAASFARQATSAAARLVDVAGREGMLSQRIAKDHLLITEHFGDDDVHQELTFACVDFSRALADLRGAPNNTAELRAELTYAAVAWRDLLELLRSESGVRDRVLAGCEDLLQRMERITQLYEL